MMSKTPSPPRSINGLRIIVGATICGLLSAAASLAGLGIYIAVRYPGLDWGRFYEFCGFPALGVFAVMSASFAIAKTMNVSIAKSVVVVGLFSVVAWAVTTASGIGPRIHRGADVVHWQRPEFVTWLIAPPWAVALVACIIGSYRHRHRTKSSETTE